MTDERTEAVELKGRRDIAWLLTIEFAQWFGRLGSKGAMPRAFTGITVGQKQVVVVLSGLPFDPVQRREFLIWLCRHEQIAAYVYATAVHQQDKGSAISEKLEFHASSPAFNIITAFDFWRDGDTVQFQAESVWIADVDGSEEDVFHGLQRASDTIADADAQAFAALWRQLKPRCLWRDRRVQQH